jgi:drug/metabolite transporter (DMT)-like permease
MEKQNPIKLYSAIILAMVCFSLSFVWFKVANVTYGPLTIVFSRLVISAVILFIYAKLSKGLIIPKKKDFKFLLLLAFCEPFLYFMGESFGLQYISSTVAAVIIATIPLFAPIAGYIFYREKISLRIFVGILVSFSGVTLVIYEIGKGITASPFGVMLQFIAVFSAIAYTVVLRKISNRMNNLSIIFFQNLIGAVFFLPFWFIFEKNRLIATPFDPEAMMAILKLSVFASSLAFIFFSYSVRHMGISKSNIFVNIIPVCTAIFAWIILNDQLTLQKFIGIIVVIGGLFIAQMKFKKQYNGPDPIPFD